MRRMIRCLPRSNWMPWALLIGLAPLATWAADHECGVVSGQRLTPVIELYTSEGCSSCPPADAWFSTLKGQPVVAQAFHVGYWDQIGWVDRFASPAFTTRQRQIAAANHLNGIYTPQLVRHGRDWRDWRESPAMASNAMARAMISLHRNGDADRFEALVRPAAIATTWTAYWSVTEDGHSSRVKAGENAGEFLKHDFVVRQYTPVGQYQGERTLEFFAIPEQPGHPRHINLVVSDLQTGEPLQAVSLTCS